MEKTTQSTKGIRIISILEINIRRFIVMYGTLLSGKAVMP
jgi:hypothetical protein